MQVGLPNSPCIPLVAGRGATAEKERGDIPEPTCNPIALGILVYPFRFIILFLFVSFLFL
jgi:hypothetical protein